jgi:hypothetical protein
MNEDLAPLLKELNEPAPPTALKANVMARIARDVERHAEVQVTAPVRRRADLKVWLYTLAGLGAILFVFADGWLTAGVLPDLTSARIGMGRTPLMPFGTPAWVLWIGFIVYLAGLFAPLRDTSSK